MKSAREVAERTIALAAISEAAHQQPPIGIRGWLDKHNLNRTLSEWEQSFISEDSAPYEWLVQASWRVEACAVLLWALKINPIMSPPIEDTTLGELGIDETTFANPELFIERASLRSEKELEEMQIEIEHQHWGVRAGPAGRRLFGGKETDSAFNPGIVYQRHYAINWVVGLGEGWDNVPTDT